LSGPAFEQSIEPTVEELKKIKPEVLVPMHCTGWTAVKRMAETFPLCVLSSVGTKVLL